MLVLSVCLYAATRALDLHIPGMPLGGSAAQPFFFNPLAWQVLLVTGAVLATKPAIRPQPHLAWDIAAVTVLLTAFAVQVSTYLSRHGYFDVASMALVWMQSAVIVENAKIGLHPLRLVNILARACLAFRLAPHYGRWLTSPPILCGRQSLPVFCAGADADPAAPASTAPT